jgi:hypothetical protein
MIPAIPGFRTHNHALIIFVIHTFFHDVILPFLFYSFPQARITQSNHTIFYVCNPKITSSLQSFSIGARPWSLCITPGDSRILCACDTSGIKIIDTSDGSICFRDKKACRQLKFWGGSNVVLL